MFLGDTLFAEGMNLATPATSCQGDQKGSLLKKVL